MALAVSLDGNFAFIGNHNGTFITVVDTKSHETNRIHGGWNGHCV